MHLQVHDQPMIAPVKPSPQPTCTRAPLAATHPPCEPGTATKVAQPPKNYSTGPQVRLASCRATDLSPFSVPTLQTLLHVQAPERASFFDVEMAHVPKVSKGPSRTSVHVWSKTCTAENPKSLPPPLPWLQVVGAPFSNASDHKKCIEMPTNRTWTDVELCHLLCFSGDRVKTRRTRGNEQEPPSRWRPSSSCSARKRL